MTIMLEKEFDYYLSHQDELVKKYRGKHVVIVGEEVIGAFEDEMEAIRETSKTHEMGTFFVQQCEPGDENYTQRFYSRVVFA